MALPTKEPVTPQYGVVRIAFVASAVPRRCGIATFTADLMAAVKAADPAVRCVAAAIDEPNTARPYGPDVRWRIKQGDKESYRRAARAINESSVDAVNLQHEFGLYGVWRDGVYDDHCVPFLETLQKPVITTLHTVLPQPEPQIRETVRRIAEHSTRVVEAGRSEEHTSELQSRGHLVCRLLLEKKKKKNKKNKKQDKRIN